MTVGEGGGPSFSRIPTGSQPTPCPACGGRLVPWRRVANGEPGGPAVALLRCDGCGSAATAAPADASAHDTGAYAKKPRLAGAASPLLAAFDRARLRRLPPPPGRVLDAGAGRGRFVAAARRAGYDAVGIEPSPRGATNVEATTIEDAAFDAAAFDAVTLWHVLEHLDDPGGGLDRIATWLEPGGTFLVGVPNLASLQAKLGGPRWFHLDAPRHRTHFTPRGLHTLLRAHGFEPVATHHVLLEHNPFGMWQSLVSRLTPTPSFLYHLLKRNARPRPADVAITVLALPLLPFAALLELLAGLARRGGTVMVVARRRAP